MSTASISSIFGALVWISAIGGCTYLVKSDQNKWAMLKCMDAGGEWISGDCVRIKP